MHWACVGNDLLFLEFLDPFEALGEDFLLHDGLLPEFVGAGNLLLPGSVASFFELGGCRRTGGTRLGQAAAHLGRIDDDKGIALVNFLSFDSPKLLDPARDLPRDTVFGCFGLSLDHEIRRTGYEISHERHD